MNSKIKVSVDRLLECVRKRREQAVKDHAKAVVEYEKERIRTQTAVVKALRAAADRAEKGDLPSSGYNYLSIPWKGRLESEPSPEPDTARIDRLIKTLELASEPSILISADDAAQYLG